MFTHLGIADATQASLRHARQPACFILGRQGVAMEEEGLDGAPQLVALVPDVEHVRHEEQREREEHQRAWRECGHGVSSASVGLRFEKQETGRSERRVALLYPCCRLLSHPGRPV